MSDILPVRWIVVEENTTALCIATTDFENQTASTLDNDLRGPNLHIYCVNLARNDGLHVGREILAPRQVITVLGVAGVDLAQAGPEPTLCERDGVAGCTSVEHFLAGRPNVTEC